MVRIDFFRSYLRRIADEQLLLASATTELGVVATFDRVYAISRSWRSIHDRKEAPVISYALDADAILVSARWSATARKSDQVAVIVERGAAELEKFAGWDTLGFRGTCSLGFVLRGEGDAAQILPLPYAEILAQSMHPFSHLIWGSLWLGLATDAVNRARASVRKKVLENPDAPPVSALRLAEVDEVLFGMRSGLYETMAEYQTMLNTGDAEAFTNFGFNIRVNNVKITCSELVVDIVGRALPIVGISGYRNDSKNSLTRHLRDAYGAPLW